MKETTDQPQAIDFRSGRTATIPAWSNIVAAYDLTLTGMIRAECYLLGCEMHALRGYFAGGLSSIDEAESPEIQRYGFDRAIGHKPASF